MMISITIIFITMVRNNKTAIRIYIKAVIIIVVIIIIVRTITMIIVEIVNIIIQLRLTVRCQGKC